MKFKILPPDDSYQYKKGDLVAVYSLHSFGGPGFYNGTIATVNQDQHQTGSVLVRIPKYTLLSGDVVDRESYEVYPQQLRRVEAYPEIFSSEQVPHDEVWLVHQGDVVCRIKNVKRED